MAKKKTTQPKADPLAKLAGKVMAAEPLSDEAFAEQEASLQQRAAALNLAWDDFSKYVRIYGAGALDLADLWVRQGMTTEWVSQAFDKLKPALISLLIAVRGDLATLPDDASSMPEQPAGVFTGLFKGVFEQLLNRLKDKLPELIDKYGADIIGALLK
jgi:hypothetical protein